MSTKIYFAWRVPLGRLNDFIDHVRARGLKRAAAQIKAIIATYGPDKLGPEPEWLKESPKEGAQERWRLRRGYDLFRDAARAEPFMFDDLNCWINVWLHNGAAYVHGCNVEPPRWAKDYSYWNNSDAPKSISQRAWAERGRRWDAICCGEGTASHSARRLQHVIVEPKELGFNFDLLVAVLGKKSLGLK